MQQTCLCHSKVRCTFEVYKGKLACMAQDNHLAYSSSFQDLCSLNHEVAYNHSHILDKMVHKDRDVEEDKAVGMEGKAEDMEKDKVEDMEEDMVVDMEGDKAEDMEEDRAVVLDALN